MLKIFEGKTPTERNKIIAAAALGTMALLAFYNLFIGFSPSRKTTTVTVSTSPTPSVSPTANIDVVAMPTRDEMDTVYQSTPVFYNSDSFYAPNAGRNIFAFYEPPVPTPYSPTPFVAKPTPTPIPPTPVPTPPQLIAFVTPQSVYAGSKTFRLEVNGDKFTPDSVIIFNGNQLPTTFVSVQKLYADVPSNFISGAGGAQITVQSPSGLFSNPYQLAIQAPPQPGFRFIGLIARKRGNNDTAYFEDQSKPQQPFGARLNDVVAGRFRLVSISPSEVVFEDVNLSFRHRLALYRPSPGQADSGTNNRNPYNTGAPGFPTQPGMNPAGIPNNIPQYIPPQPQPTTPPADEDDDGDN